MKPERNCPTCSELSHYFVKGECRPCYDRTYAAVYAKRNRNLVRAHWAVANAVLKGELVSLQQNYVECVDCGGEAEHYDHRDYLKPLVVDPVCRSCNKKRGRGLNAEAA